MAPGAKEKRFLDEIEALFTGATVEGDSGFVNLMSIKHDYFQSIRTELIQKVDDRVERNSSFREELFDKLYTFFHRYFCESGSIYFRHVSAFSKVYERVYAEGNDVALTWKTHKLYYVKSDVLVRSMQVEVNEQKRFYFDASRIQNKKNNERREFVFTLAKSAQAREKGTITLEVSYSQRGTTTKMEEIIKESHKRGAILTEDDLRTAFRLFRRQSEADYFIHKDAWAFLREQFDLWLYQYLFQEETVFAQTRLRQIQSIKEIAYCIIDFIAQFEDELRRVWEKPKFVRNVNYVVTLDKLTDSVLQKIPPHPGATAQLEEWRNLELVDTRFSMNEIFNGQKHLSDTNGATANYRFLPLDTKYFKDMELEILLGLGNLDEALDGELVHGENWQALNTLQERHKGKVQCIYIDPPFNLESSDQFDYRTNYKDACWATMLENRLRLARAFLSDTGSIFLRCDNNGNHIVRFLLNDVFHQNNFRNHIMLGKSAKITEEITRYHNDHDSLFFYSRSSNCAFRAVEIKRKKRNWQPMHLSGVRWSPIPSEYIELFSHHNIKKSNSNAYGTRARIILGEERLPPEGRHWALSQRAIFEAEKRGEIRKSENNGQPEAKQAEHQRLTDNWTDSVGYARNWDFSTENHETVLYRTIKTATEHGDTCLDFFAGSGTAQAVAQKLGRKWIGVEMGEHFYSVLLPRMKKVVAGYASGISREVPYRGGGIFKYYSLEQYEETLKNARYKDGEQLKLDSARTPFEQYVFFGDDKLAHAVQRKSTDGLEINLHHLYTDIDVAESLSNILGKQIRTHTANMVTFADGTTEKTNPSTMNESEKLHFISLIKPYLWWGEGSL